MKIIQFIAYSLLFLSLNSCQKLDLEVDVPNCIETKIMNIMNEPVQNPAAEVWEWKDDQNTYYYIISGCCDQYNYLYNDKCNVVCAPDGGFTGLGDGNCTSFQGQVQKTLVWKDPRE